MKIRIKGIFAYASNTDSPLLKLNKKHNSTNIFFHKTAF